MHADALQERRRRPALHRLSLRERLLPGRSKPWLNLLPLDPRLGLLHVPHLCPLILHGPDLPMPLHGLLGFCVDCLDLKSISRYPLLFLFARLLLSLFLGLFLGLFIFLGCPGLELP